MVLQLLKGEMMVTRILGASLLAGLLLFSASFGGEDKASGAITAVGEKKLFDGKLNVAVTESDGKLDFRITRNLKQGNTTLSPPHLLKKEGGIWVIFPESADRIWFFWDSTLFRWDLELTDQEAKTTSKSFNGKKAVENAPKAVLERLQKDLVEKLKGK